MELEEYRSALLAFLGDNPSAVQSARVELACVLKAQLDETLPSGLSVKITNSLCRVLREMDSVKVHTRPSPAIKPLLPSKAPKFVSKRRMVAE